MRPMDFLGTFAGKVAAGVLALATLGLAISSMGTSDVKLQHDPRASNASNTPVIRNDSYVLSLNIKNDGRRKNESHYLEQGKNSEYSQKWRFGPTTFSVRLVNDDESTDIGYGHNMYYLQDWAERIEILTDTTKHKDYHPYAKEMHKVLKEAKALQEDAALIVRVLDGIQTYRFLDKDSWITDAPGHLVSEDPSMRFDGAQAQNYHSNRREGRPNPEKYSLPSWSPESEEDKADVRTLARDFGLLAWHYDQADIKRIRTLLRDIDTYEERLTLDMSAFKKKEREEFLLQSAADDLRASFYESFMLGLLEVSRAANWLAPQEKQKTFWASSAQDVHPVYETIRRDSYGRDFYANPVVRVDLMDFPFPQKEVAFTLPEMPDGGLVSFLMPLRGIEKRDYPIWSRRHNDTFNYFAQYSVQYPYDGTESYTVVSPHKARHGFMRLEEGEKKDYVHSRSAIFAPIVDERASGTLTAINIYDKEYMSDNKKVRYHDSFRDEYTIGWTVQHEGEICASAECFPEEEKEEPEYQPPPVIALEAATYPPVPVPDEPAAIAFRVQNNGDIIASALTLELKLINALSGEAAKDLEAQGNFCKKGAKPGSYRCEFGDMPPGASADLLFDAKTPQKGQFMWLANLDSKGDIGGLKDLGGILGEYANPEILDVVVIDRQIEFEDSVPVTPYPYGPSGDGDFTRNLFIVGQNLPKEKADVKFQKNAELKYFLEAFEDTKNRDHQEIIDHGWMKYYGLDNAQQARAKAKEEGLSGILVDTRIASKDIMPGTKTLYLNGIASDWELQFGDIAASVYFVRPIENEPFDLLANAAAPTRIYLAVQTNMTLPINTLELDLDLSGSGVKGAGTQKITVSRKDYLDKTIYISEPLDLHGDGQTPAMEGGIGIPVKLNRKNPPIIRAHMNKAFAAKSFLLASPVAEGALQVWTTPETGEYSWLWKNALNRAAACNDDLKGKSLETVGAAEADELWNLIIWTLKDHLPGQSVKLGQHAAMLLLRDMYLNLAVNKDSSEANKFARILKSDEALDGYLKIMRTKYYDKDIPVLRMKVPDIDYGETEYKYIVLNDNKWLAEHHNLSVDEVKKRRRRATQAAIEVLLKQSKEAQEYAKGIDDCDIEELTLLTGFNFEPISRVLKSEIVTLAEARRSNGTKAVIWSSDSTARYWIDQVAPLAEALRKQKKEASIDTDLTLFLTSIAAMPLMLSEHAAVTVISFGIDLLDFGATFYSEVSQYIESSREITFSKGAAILLGEERYKKAQEDAKAWYSAAVQIGISGLGAVGGTAEIISKIPETRLKIKIARGRRTAEAMPSAEAINTLNAADRQNFTAFAMSSHMRRAELGADVLNETERRAIELVDQYASGRMATKPEPQMDMPGEVMLDSFQPKEDIVFELINSSGVRKLDAGAPNKVQPPPGFDTGASSAPMSRSVKIRQAEQSIESAKFSDEFPNVFDERVPDDTIVKVLDEAGGEMDIELGARVGEGSTSEAFALLDDPENFVVRVTYLREGSAALELDSFGDSVLRNIIKSEHVRAVKIREEYKPAPGRFRRDGGESAAPAVRVTVAERVTPAFATLAEQKEGLVPEFRVRADGTPRDYSTMTAAQMQAYEGAMRDLNAQGYVWLDNKPDNFGFVDFGDGSGRVQVVIIDPGGIVPVRQSVADFRGITKAELAREIQLVANGDFEKNLPDFVGVKSMSARSYWRKELIKDQYDEAIDLDALGLDDIENLWFNQIGGEMFDYVARLLEAAE